MTDNVEQVPRVSVVIPTFNRASQVARAIDSVLDQTLPPEEIIVVDDGSSDTTRETLARYGDPVRYVYQINAGPAAARNRGIELATGTLIAFLDSDDTWLPNKLAIQVARFARRPELGIVATNVIYRHASGDVESDLADPDTASIRSRFLDNVPMVTSSVVVRTDCVRALGGFDVSLLYAEDWDFFYRIVRAHDAEILPDCLTVMNVSEPRMMDSAESRERLIAHTLTFLDRLYSYAENVDKIARKRRTCRAFLRWVALKDVNTNPAFARKQLLKVLSYRLWDPPVYAAILRTYLGRSLS